MIFVVGSTLEKVNYELTLITPHNLLAHTHPPLRSDARCDQRRLLAPHIKQYVISTTAVARRFVVLSYNGTQQGVGMRMKAP